MEIFSPFLFFSLVKQMIICWFSWRWISVLLSFSNRGDRGMGRWGQKEGLELATAYSLKRWWQRREICSALSICPLQMAATRLQDHIYQWAYLPPFPRFLCARTHTLCFTFITHHNCVSEVVIRIPISGDSTEKCFWGLVDDIVKATLGCL